MSSPRGFRLNLLEEGEGEEGAGIKRAGSKGGRKETPARDSLCVRKVYFYVLLQLRLAKMWRRSFYVLVNWMFRSVDSRTFRWGKTSKKPPTPLNPSPLSIPHPTPLIPPPLLFSESGESFNASPSLLFWRRLQSALAILKEGDEKSKIQNVKGFFEISCVESAAAGY